MVTAAALPGSNLCRCGTKRRGRAGAVNLPSSAANQFGPSAAVSYADGRMRARGLEIVA
ncbi:hypothetical protein SAMN06295937_100826 [Sphingopyxis flava]|uniref:Uncharacterized protein n=1 Tax=Sphingopyxis flava TaxID=1507287 RepID=A0A1T5BYG9_9SPHN|nr:hypothetical protein SAMN06295937_100826 [Sphingopyxis flava]